MKITANAISVLGSACGNHSLDASCADVHLPPYSPTLVCCITSLWSKRGRMYPNYGVHAWLSLAVAQTHIQKLLVATPLWQRSGPVIYACTRSEMRSDGNVNCIHNTFRTRDKNCSLKRNCMPLGINCDADACRKANVAEQDMLMASHARSGMMDTHTQAA